MWKMNHRAVRETTWPSQQNHTRQIDIIRQRPWVIFLRKYFTRLPFFLPPSLLLSSVLSSESICFSLLAQTNLRTRGLLCWVGLGQAEPGWARSGRFYFQAQTQGRVFEGQGSGVRERAGVERIGQRSLEYKPLPHAPRTAVWLLFPVFKHYSGRREVAITQRATENLVFPASPHTAHIWSQATCSFNAT